MLAAAGERGAGARPSGSLVTWSCLPGLKGHPAAILQVQAWSSEVLSFLPAASLKREGSLPGGGGSRARGPGEPGAGCENDAGSGRGPWGCSLASAASPGRQPSVSPCPELRRGARWAGSPGSVLRSPKPLPAGHEAPHTQSGRRQSQEHRAPRLPTWAASSRLGLWSRQEEDNRVSLTGLRPRRRKSPSTFSRTKSRKRPPSTDSPGPRSSGRPPAAACCPPWA